MPAPEPGSVLRVSVDAPILPASINLTHHSTSWVFTTYPDFTLQDYVTLTIDNDTVNLTSYDYITDNIDKPLYCKLKFHFDTGAGIIDSEWSKIIIVRPDQSDTRDNDILLTTPIINNIAVGEENIVFTINDMVTYSGTATHNKTSWSVLGGNSRVIFTSPNDEVNLKSISVPKNIFEDDTAYIIRAKYHTLEDIDSNYGKVIFKTDPVLGNLFNIGMTSQFKVNSRMYFDVKLHSNETHLVDVVIVLLETGEVIDYKYDQNTLTPVIDVTNLDINKIYKIKARVKLGNGDITGYKTIYTGKPKINDLVIYNQFATYDTDYTLVQNLNLKSATVQSSVQLPDGSILISKHMDNNVYRYEMYNGILTEIEVAFELDGVDDMLDMQYVNFVPLPDGKLLVDYNALREIHDGSHLLTEDIVVGEEVVVVYDGTDVVKFRPRFMIYDYNTVTKRFTLIEKVYRDDELIGTSPTNSIAVIGDDVYYIPTYIEIQDNVMNYVPELIVDEDMVQDDTNVYGSVTLHESFELEIRHVPYNYTKVPLTIRKLNLTTFTITNLAPLPYGTIKSFANIIRTRDNRLLVLGGSTDPVVDEVTGVTLHYRVNNNVYEYNASANTFTNLATISPSELDISIYCMQSYMRRDGNIVLFNNVDVGAALGDQSTYIYDTTYNKLVKFNNTVTTDIPIRSSILLNNGTVVRITARANDPQHVYHYTSYIDNSLVFTDNNAELTINDHVNDTTISKLISDINDYEHDSTKTTTDFTDEVTEVNRVTDLVINPGERILVEDLNKFNSITVLGTSEADTGILELVAGNYVLRFKYNDLIVNDAVNVLETDEFSSVTLLPGSEINID